MPSNFHTHSSFSDGKASPEEIVLCAIDMGLDSVGFSDHGYTAFDLTYCMQDVEGYIRDIKRLKEKYQDKIQVYLGVEEDAFHPVDRSRFDYVIGSSHYLCVDGKYYPIDGNQSKFDVCFDLCDREPCKLADVYYAPFCEYIKKRKPDIVGHFDLITKFDEDKRQLLGNGKYLAISERYLSSILNVGCLFEVNTGAMARGYRKSPYPYDNLLFEIYKNGAGLVLASDSHSPQTLLFAFEETVKYLKDFGFRYVYSLKDGKFIKKYI